MITGTSSGHGVTSSAAFVPNLESKSGSANLPDGVIHIFKDSSKQLHLLPEAEQQSGATPSGIDNTTLAILAVPSWMTPSDFLTFVAPVADSLKHLRVIRRVQY
jgi:BRCA1-associated protein